MIYVFTEGCVQCVSLLSLSYLFGIEMLSIFKFCLNSESSCNFKTLNLSIKKLEKQNLLKLE